MLIILAGALAQLVDGGIGMGFGVTSTTILLLSMGPAQASAVVHAAEVGTTLVSGISHWRFGNVNWKVVLKLGVPGAIGAFIGATVLSHIALDVAKPLTSIILALVGVNLLWRFSRGVIVRKNATKPYRTPFLVFLGVFGGLVDATGGGGWGPVTTATLMSLGKEEPRRVVGTVNTAEFLVSLAATLGFVMGLWHELQANLVAVLCLLLGGALTAPLSAWLVGRINPIILGGFVGTALISLNIDHSWPFAIVAGVILTTLGVRRARKSHVVESTEVSEATATTAEESVATGVK
ncbi:MAG: sulfite exporter TauE/SafE family protein [Corynebacterium sp.]|nr:sulfite exporter TauE/SafE family protein [Corynebacterium sp.]